MAMVCTVEEDQHNILYNQNNYSYKTLEPPLVGYTLSLKTVRDKYNASGVIKVYTHFIKPQGLGRFNRQMSLWPLSLESYGPCIKRLGH